MKTKISFRLGISALALAVSVPLQAHSAPGRRLLMGVLGDSLSAATFANTEVQSSSDVALWPDIPGISQNKKTLSWASGREIHSHFMRLKETISAPDQLSVLNVAVPGGMAMDLDAQAAELESAMRSGKFDELVYVTLLIGGNDVCTESFFGELSDETFKEAIHRPLAKLASLRAAKPIRVLLSSLPRIPELGRPDIQEATTWLGLSCRQMRNILSYCRSLTQWTTRSGYDRGVALIESKNRVLREVAAESKSRYPGLEVVYSEALYRDALFKPEFLAFDCFHSSKAGQEMISSLLWDAQPWFK